MQNIDNMRKGIEAQRDFEKTNEILDQFFYIRQVIEEITQVRLESYVTKV